jgi:hypothetical protein
MLIATCSSVTSAGLGLFIYCITYPNGRFIHLCHTVTRIPFMDSQKRNCKVSVSLENEKNNAMFFLATVLLLKQFTFHSLDPGLTLLRGRMIQHANTPRLQLAKLDLQVRCDWSAFHETSHDWLRAVR